MYVFFNFLLYVLFRGPACVVIYYFKIIMTCFKIEIQKKNLHHRLGNILPSTFDYISIHSKIQHNRVK